jgi:hypothetical protein
VAARLGTARRAREMQTGTESRLSSSRSQAQMLTPRRRRERRTISAAGSGGAGSAGGVGGAGCSDAGGAGG